jgi:dipeptidyl-peptidase-4
MSCTRFEPVSRVVVRVAMLAVFAAPVLAQAHANKANWTLADKFSNAELRPSLYSTAVQPHWIGKGDSMWYNWRDHNGSRFLLVYPKKAKQPLFDHQKLAEALSAIGRRPADPQDLPINSIAFSKDRKTMLFVADSSCFAWSVGAETLARAATRQVCSDTTLLGSGLIGGRGGRGGGGGGGQGGRGGGRGAGGAAEFRNFSPDSSMFVFARNHNLFLVTIASSRDTIQITHDGVQDYSFGARDTTQQGQQQQEDDQNDTQQQQQLQQQQAANGDRVRANVTWSPDSKAFFIQRRDQRKVADIYLIDWLSIPRPRLIAWKYPMPGEENVPTQELYVFKKGDTKLTRVPMEKWKYTRVSETAWPGKTSESIRFVRQDRAQRNLEYVEYSLASNAVTALITESVDVANIEHLPFTRYVGSGPNADFLWWSERSGWGHFYLYDHSGRLKNAVTSGQWRADALVEVDTVKRALYVAGVGREAGENPYYRHLYRANLDGTSFTLLDAGDASHPSTEESLSPSRKYYVDNWSRIDQVPKTVLRDEFGKVAMDLETTDVSRLAELGWKPAERFVVKADDGITDIYGNIFKPFDFDPTKKYPVIAHVYPGPQTESVSYTFSANSGDQRLAQLGFIVVQIGHRGGSPQRSNAYQSFSYYNLRDYALPDTKRGLEELAARFPWIDIERVGIYGHSGGGFMTGAALLLPPYNEFFKVGVASSGNHDNNVYGDYWAEQYQGLREVANAPATGQVTVADGGRASASGEGVTQAGRASGGNGGGRGGGGGRAGGGGRGGAAGVASTNITNGGLAVYGRGAAGTSTNIPMSAYTQPRVAPATDSTHYEIHVPTNAELAANLKGKLLLVHGDQDNNVSPAGTMRLVDALIKANKRFDLMIMTGQLHGYGTMQEYFNTRMMEYFAEHLLDDNYGRSADMREHRGGR